jgi:inositol 1,4,5-triphosphate receptor type 1
LEVSQFNYKEVGYIKHLFRFLQLLCEGHNLDLQKYLNNQPDNFKSVDIITDCLKYVLDLHKHIDHTNIKIAKQSFKSLTEFIQGPCIENQRILGKFKKL